MSKELPKISAKAIITVLEVCGFILSRQSGSHKIYKNQNGKRTTVPFHGSKILHPKVLKNILIDADISLDELKKLL
ncbi:MAG: type II toxin-antitoxin system HicA family toxin [Patescibacteria group bacterium]